MQGLSPLCVRFCSYNSSRVKFRVLFPLPSPFTAPCRYSSAPTQHYISQFRYALTKNSGKAWEKYASDVQGERWVLWAWRLFSAVLVNWWSYCTIFFTFLAPDKLYFLNNESIKNQNIGSDDQIGPLNFSALFMILIKKPRSQNMHHYAKRVKVPQANLCTIIQVGIGCPLVQPSGS